MGRPELLFLIGVPLLFVLPVWLSFRTYRGELALWRQLSCVASLFGSWAGFVMVRCIHQAYAGYQEQRRANIGK